MILCKMCSIGLPDMYSASMCSDCSVAYAQEFKAAILYSVTSNNRLRCRHCALDEPTFANFCSLGKHYHKYHIELEIKAGRSAS